LAAHVLIAIVAHALIVIVELEVVAPILGSVTCYDFGYKPKIHRTPVHQSFHFHLYQPFGKADLTCAYLSYIRIF
jgi:hypothetical protein